MTHLEEFDDTIKKLSKAYDIPPLTWKDIAQELRIHLYKKRNEYDPNKAKYSTWAYTVCRNKIYNLNKYWRRKKRHSRMSLEKLFGMVDSSGNILPEYRDRPEEKNNYFIDFNFVDLGNKKAPSSEGAKD